MRLIRFGLVAAVLAFMGGASPERASAQSESGWWESALIQLVQRAEDGPRARPGERDRDGPTLSDILRERIERSRRDRDAREDDRDDEWEDERDEDEWEDERDEDEWEDEREDRARDARGRRGKGPPFCRNGQGHPVHGMEWCRKKGWSSGSVLRLPGDRRWEDRGWEDIILKRPRPGERRQRTVDEGGLLDILGDVVLGRVDGERRRLGGTRPLEGRWLDLGPDGRILQIRSGDVPVAELTDVDGDARVDVVLVPRR